MNEFPDTGTPSVLRLGAAPRVPGSHDCMLASSSKATRRPNHAASQHALESMRNDGMSRMHGRPEPLNGAYARPAPSRTYLFSRKYAKGSDDPKDGASGMPHTPHTDAPCIPPDLSGEWPVQTRMPHTSQCPKDLRYAKDSCRLRRSIECWVVRIAPTDVPNRVTVNRDYTE